VAAPVRYSGSGGGSMPSRLWALPAGGMPRYPYIREKFTRDLSFARELAREYFERFPKDRYETEVESWRQIQSQNIEFTMKRLREPVVPRSDLTES
jgi:hypothetical protein